LDDEIIDLEIASSGTIVLVDKAWLLILEKKL
jgi:hypothetical protein